MAALAALLEAVSRFFGWKLIAVTIERNGTAFRPYGE